MGIRALIRRWLRRRPNPSYAICPTCGHQLSAGVARDSAPALDSHPSVDPQRSAAREAVAAQAFHAVQRVDALRRDLSETDPVKEQLLGRIEADFLHSAGDIHHRLGKEGVEDPG